MRKLLRRSNVAVLLLGIVGALWLNAPIVAAGEMTFGMAHAMAADEMAMTDCESAFTSGDRAGQMAFCGLVCAGGALALPTSASQLVITAATPVYLRRRTEFPTGLNPAPNTGPPRPPAMV